MSRRDNRWGSVTGEGSGPQQTDIFDAIERARRHDQQVAEGVRRREAGIDLVERGAGDGWFAAADRAIRHAAARYDTFTTDHIWALIDSEGVGAPPERRAMGAAMRRAMRAGVCVATDRVTPSMRPDCHRRPVRVWRAA